MPGVSTENELLAALQKMPDIKAGSILKNGGPSNSFDDIVYFNLTSKEKGQAYILENKVVQFEFDDIVNVNFQDAIQRYGSPKNIVLFPSAGPSFLGLGWVPYTEIVGVSPEEGVAYEYGFETYKSIQIYPDEIKPGTKIQWIFYFDPGSYQKLLLAGLFDNAPQWDFHPWQGYGIIATKYPQ
jgi:hypothetical protein